MGQHVVFGHPAGADEQIDGLALHAAIGGHEEPVAGVERLVELGRHSPRLAELYLIDPFRAQRIDPGATMADDHVESTFAFQVRFQR